MTVYDQIVQKYENNPVDFINKHLLAPKGISLNTWQIKFLDAMMHNQAIAVQSARGTGKSELCAAIAVWWMMTKKDCQVTITSSTFGQLKKIFYRVLKKTIKGSKFRDLFTVNSETITYIPTDVKCSLIAWNAERTSSTSGEHNKNSLTVIDEAVDVGSQVFESAEGTLQDSDSKILALGNPIRVGTAFYDLCTSPNTTYYVFKITAYEVEHIPRSWIENVIKRYGKDSFKARTEVFGEFPDMDETSVFDQKVISNAFKIAHVRSGDVYAGLDIASFGNDKTVLTLLDDNGIILNKSWNSGQHEVICYEIYKTCLQYEVKTLNCDATGEGFGLSRMLIGLAKDSNLKVNSIKFSEKASQPDKYLNQRVEMYYRLKYFLQDGTKSLQNVEEQDELRQELIGQHFDIKEKGVIKLVSKDEFRKQYNRSPDYSDSLALCLAAYSQDLKTGMLKIKKDKKPVKLSPIRIW